MQGIKRKLVYVTLFEVLAIMLTSSLVMLAGYDLLHAGGMAVATSATAVVWNLVWNTGFEFWEARQQKRGRDFWRRAGHAVGFELGLTLLIVPLIAWWLQVRWWEALVLDIGLTLVFVVFTFLFNLGFDRVFGLPLSAQPRETPAQEAQVQSLPAAADAGESLPDQFQPEQSRPDQSRPEQPRPEQTGLAAAPLSATESAVSGPVVAARQGC